MSKDHSINGEKTTMNGLKNRSEDVRDEYIDDVLDDKYTDKDSDKKYRWEPKWANIIYLSIVHLCAPYGLYLAFTSAKWPTIIFTCCYYWLAIFGATAGAHRLWAHRSYKATWQ